MAFLLQMHSLGDIGWVRLGKIHEAGTDMGKLYFFLNTLVGGKNKELLPEKEQLYDDEPPSFF